MKKTLPLGLALAAALATSTAGADRFGAHIGTSSGLQYVQDLPAGSALRYSLNLNAVRLFSGGSLAVGGDVAYLNPFGGSQDGLSPYYGAGLGADVSLGNTTGFSVYPHGILGVNYALPAPFSLFLEGSAGANIGIGSNGGGVGFGFGARLGVNYRF